MSKRSSVAVAVAAVVVSAGCSGGGGGDDPRPSSSPTSAAGPQLIDPGRDLCKDVTADMTRAYLPRGTHSEQDKCSWVQDFGTPGQRGITVASQVSGILEDNAAESIEAAKKTFRSPPLIDLDLRKNPPTPLSGVGDEASVIRHSGLGGPAVTVSVRVRNAVLWVSAWGGADNGSATGPSFAEEEAAVADLTRTLLVKLDPSLPPVFAGGSGFRPGEFPVVADPCVGAGAEAARLLPDLRGQARQPEFDGLRGCAWKSTSYTQMLSVDVEVAAPSPLTGQDATQTAGQLLKPWTDRVPHEAKLTQTAGLGDESYQAYEDTRTYLWVRKANIMISIEYANPEDTQRTSMLQNAAAVARSVLAQYPS